MLTACVTVSNTLSVQEVASFHLTGVRVLMDHADVRWGDGEVAYARSIGRRVQDADALGQTEPARIFIRNLAAAKIEAVMGRELAPVLMGDRPVRVDVSVKTLDIPPPIQRILIGGDPMLVADVTLVDAKTEQPLLTFPHQVATAMAGHGIGGAIIDEALTDQALIASPIDRIVEEYVQQYRLWLANR